MRLILAVMCAAVLAGCVTTPTHVWFNDAKTPAEFSKDSIDCNYEVAKATAGFKSDGSLSDAIDLAQRKSEIEVLCWQSKGYRLKEIAKTNK